MKQLLTILFLLSAWVSFGQSVQKEENPPEESIDELRTQSGVDPTRISSRVGYSYMFIDKQSVGAQINNRIVAALGINNWSFQVKTDVVTTNLAPGGRWTSGLGDLRFSMLNAFYVKGKSAWASSLEFGIPTASQSIAQYAGMGTYFYATQSVTYSYTITPSLMLAVQPQYTFSITKPSKDFPDLSTLTLRVFLAYFAKSGFFFVLETRPVYDFGTKNFDVVLGPIIGKSLGAGYNLVFLSDIPTNKANLHSKGAIYQLGITKTF